MGNYGIPGEHAASIAWWPSLAVLVLAAIIDIRTRRIPNWLSVPFLLAAVGTRTAMGGWPGMRDSIGGIAVTLVLFGVPCFLGFMGMGDLKLAMGAAAWIGPSQFFFAFIVTGMVAGVMAAVYALRNRALGNSLDGAGELVVALAKRQIPRGKRIGRPGAISIPYAPALAVGTLFSFFAR